MNAFKARVMEVVKENQQLHMVSSVCFTSNTTAEFPFLELPRKTKTGSRNREVQKSGGKILSEANSRGMTFGSSYRED